MGYLSAKDTGFTGIQIVNNLVEGITVSSTGAINPTDNYGVIDLRSYKFSYNGGKIIDAKPNIAGNITRVNAGSSNITSFTLSCKINSKPSKYEGEIAKYFLTWSRSKNIIMLFYMPNETDSTLSYNQDTDFFYSDLKTLYDVLWDSNLGTNPYGVSTYGSSRFYTGLTHSSGAYNACAIPVLIENITVETNAGIIGREIKITGIILENEGV